MKKKLFIGITSWNSEQFLDVCLTAIARTTSGINPEIVVFDNCSTDRSSQVAEKHGARVIQQTVSQSDALNMLLEQSRAEFTLLIHADTVLLANNWFEHLTSRMGPDTVMISPEDVGCGLMSRSVGKGHPESSFMFFDTRHVKEFRRWKITRRRLLVPLEIKRRLDFDNAHLTHGLVAMFARRNACVRLMQVLYSRVLDEPRYSAGEVQASAWRPALAHLEYGLGNFYALDGVVTHYHNWYDRVSVHHYMRSAATTEPDNNGYPVEFVKAYSQQFIDDYRTDNIQLPQISQAPAESVLARFAMRQPNE